MMGPWPCDPSGNSTVPVRDRIQVNRVIRSLDLQACCASIAWAKNDVLAPEAAVQQCPAPVMWEYSITRFLRPKAHRPPSRLQEATTQTASQAKAPHISRPLQRAPQSGGLHL